MLAILAYKGFTTITNSGYDLTDPRRNFGRAIVASLVICAVIYLLVAFAVGSSLTLNEIVKAKDHLLAQASRPAFEGKEVWLTVAIAVIATASGPIASILAVSRMLTEMNLILHRHFGVPGRIQKHQIVYTAAIAAALDVLFDLSQIALLGAFLYLIMDMVIHWGMYRTLRRDLGANGIILLKAINLDAIALAAFKTMKWRNDHERGYFAGSCVVIPPLVSLLCKISKGYSPRSPRGRESGPKRPKLKYWTAPITTSQKIHQSPCIPSV